MSLATRQIARVAVVLLMAPAMVQAQRAAVNGPVRLLATVTIETLERELNQAAQAGYRFESTTAGRTDATDEVIAILGRTDDAGRYRYRVLAVGLNPFAQLQSAARDGYEYRAHTVRVDASGERLVIVLEQDSRSQSHWEYVVKATDRTATMEKELNEAVSAGYTVVDSMFTPRARYGHSELLVILRRPAR